MLLFPAVLVVIHNEENQVCTYGYLLTGMHICYLGLLLVQHKLLPGTDDLHHRVHSQPDALGEGLVCPDLA